MDPVPEGLGHGGVVHAAQVLAKQAVFLGSEGGLGATQRRLAVGLSSEEQRRKREGVQRCGRWMKRR